MTGVLIIGASRSGTSMTAGIFEQHGIFFGNCMGPDDRNPKGYLENRWLKKVYKGQLIAGDFARDWKNELETEGWQGGIWGAKCGAERYDQFWYQVPDIEAIVCCFRPYAQIQASRAAAKFQPNRQTVERNWQIMADLERRGLPCFRIHTPALIEGDYSALLPVFNKLGLEFRREIADAWIEPQYWQHGEVK